MPPEALLVIRSDIAAAVEQEYLEWLTREHTLERVGIKGFVSARIFRSKHSGFGRYLIFYELADASVVDSPAYLERLNNPTPWTTRMMPHLGNFVRGGGRITARWGAGYGTAMLPIMVTSTISADERQSLEEISRMPGVVAIRILQTDSERTTAASNERKLRSGDRSFETLLMIEALDEDAARHAGEEPLQKIYETAEPETASGTIRTFSQIFSLNA